MHRSLRSRILPVLVLGIPLCLVASCSSDTDSAETSKADAANSSASEADSNSTGSSDSAGADESGESASSVESDICTLLSAEEVGALLSATVTQSEQVGGGCSFEQEDPSASSLAFNTSGASDDTDGSFNEARYGAFAVLTDPTKVEPGIGDFSAIAAGSIGSGESQVGAGIVQVNRTIVQVTLTPTSGLDQGNVISLTTQAITLAASKL